jgi:hypothetical protein
MIKLFQSTVDPEIFGFTRDADGANLPARYAPWRKSGQGGSLYLGIGESSAELSTADPVIRAVQTQGFYVVGTQSRRSADQWKRSWRHAG